MKNALLLTVSLVVSLLCVELGLRLAGFEPRVLRPNPFFIENSDTTWSVPDTDLGWVNKPGVAISIEEGNAPMTFWSGGRRAMRATEAPPDSALDVLIAGGSNAQSYGVADEDAFGYRLGRMFPDIRFENFGTGGYSTVQALMLSQRILEPFYGDSPPDLIVLTFADSHIARNVSDQTWVYSIADSQGRYISPPHYRLSGGALAFEPFRTISPWPAETASALLTILHHVWLQSVRYNTSAQGMEVTRAMMSRFAEFASVQGSDFLVVVLEDYTAISSTVFAGTGIEVLDCSGYERTAPQDYLLGGGSHPNAKLHAYFAVCIGAWLDDYVAGRARSDKP